MKNHFLTLLLSLAILLAGCRTALDMENLDKTIEMDMAVAIPVGTMKATLGDFLGDQQISHLYVGEDGVFQYRDTFVKEQSYNHFDLTRYPAKASKQMNVYEKLEQEGMLIGGQITGNGQPITLTFPLSISMAELIKHEDSIRVDSAWIDLSQFASSVGITGGLPLNAGWIDQITLTLGDRIQRKAGNVVTICNKGEFQYDTNINITVDKFHINLMKNEHPSHYSGYRHNTIENLDMSIDFTFTIPNGTTITIPQNSGFTYHMEMIMATYEAMWGWFAPSDKMRDNDEITLRNEWSTWAYFDNAIVPFSEPRVDLDVITKLAGAIVMYGDSMFVEDSNGSRRYAMFDGQKKCEVHFKEGEYLDPKTSQPGDSATLHVLFDKDPARGTLADMFTIRAEKLGYAFHVGFDEQKTPQIRIIPDMSIRANIGITLPMRFHQGLDIQYQDTIYDVNISELSLDSIAKESEYIDTIKTADVKLFLRAYSMIPLHVKGVFRAYDENDQEIKDPNDPKLPLQLFSQDTIYFNPPEYHKESGYWVPTAGITTEIISLDKEKTKLMPKVKKIRFVAAADTKPLNEVFKAGMEEIRLTSDQSMKIHIGLTGKIDAILDFNDKDKEWYY